MRALVPQGILTPLCSNTWANFGRATAIMTPRDPMDAATTMAGYVMAPLMVRRTCRARYSTCSTTRRALARAPLRSADLTMLQARELKHRGCCAMAELRDSPEFTLRARSSTAARRAWSCISDMAPCRARLTVSPASMAAASCLYRTRTFSALGLEGLRPCLEVRAAGAARALVLTAPPPLPGLRKRPRG
jgi:hypothetical protein